MLWRGSLFITTCLFSSVSRSDLICICTCPKFITLQAICVRIWLMVSTCDQSYDLQYFGWSWIRTGSCTEDLHNISRVFIKDGSHTGKMASFSFGFLFLVWKYFLGLFRSKGVNWACLTFWSSARTCNLWHLKQESDH